MKWARLVDDPDRAAKKQSEQDKMSIRYIGEKDLRGEFKPWITYKFPPNCRITALSRREYEMVLGGYLLYYDNIVRSCVVDHHLYVRWESSDKTKDDGKTPHPYDSVTLFLSPPAQRKIRGKAGIAMAVNPDQAHDLTRGQHVESAATSAPDIGDLVDPPPPPPPPPPSLDDLSSTLVP